MSKARAIQVLGLQQFGVDTQFYANTISNHLTTSHLHIEKPHKHNFFATMLFTQGSGIHEIDFNSYPIKPGSVFLLLPGQTHNWRLSDDCEGVIYFHSQDFYETHYLHETLADYPFFSAVHNQAAVFLDGKAMTEIGNMFKKVLDANTGAGVKKKQLTISLITQVYIALERFIAKDDAASANGHHRYYLKFLQFQKLVEAHFIISKSANDYANWMNITPKHLNRINKMIVDKTTSEIIADRVILEAKRMLIYAKNNFNEVSDALGFNDYAHFSKLFKNKTGQSPSDFSKRYI
jgi:AraC-like DNA-binding protein